MDFDRGHHISKFFLLVRNRSSKLSNTYAIKQYAKFCCALNFFLAIEEILLLTKNSSTKVHSDYPKCNM